MCYSWHFSTSTCEQARTHVRHVQTTCWHHSWQWLLTCAIPCVCESELPSRHIVVDNMLLMLLDTPHTNWHDAVQPAKHVKHCYVIDAFLNQSLRECRCVIDLRYVLYTIGFELYRCVVCEPRSMIVVLVSDNVNNASFAHGSPRFGQHLCAMQLNNFKLLYAIFRHTFCIVVMWMFHSEYRRLMLPNIIQEHIRITH